MSTETLSQAPAPEQDEKREKTDAEVAAQISRIASKLVERSTGIGSGELSNPQYSSDNLNMEAGVIRHDKTKNGVEVQTLTAPRNDIDDRGFLVKKVTDGEKVSKVHIKVHKHGTVGMLEKLTAQNGSLVNVIHDLDMPERIHASAQILASERDAISKRRAANKSIVEDVTKA